MPMKRRAHAALLVVPMSFENSASSFFRRSAVLFSIHDCPCRRSHADARLMCPAVPKDA